MWRVQQEVKARKNIWHGAPVVDEEIMVEVVNCGDPRDETGKVVQQPEGESIRVYCIDVMTPWVVFPEGNISGDFTTNVFVYDTFRRCLPILSRPALCAHKLRNGCSCNGRYV